MGVRLKVLLSIVVVFALLAVTASYVLGFAIYGGLARLEREDMQSYAKQLVEAVMQQQSNLNDSTLDWAVWDETYQYAQRPNAKYELNNLSQLSLSLVKFDVAAILDTQGNARVWAELRQGQHRLLREIPAPFELLVDTKAYKKDEACGFMAQQPYPLLYCLHPILPSQMNKSSNGFLFTARYLDDVRLERIRRVIKLPMAFVAEPKQFSDDFEFMTDELHPFQVRVHELSKRKAQFFVRFADAQQHVFWIGLEYERVRVEYNQRFFAKLVTLALFGLGLCLIMLFFILERFLVSRLTRLEETVELASQHQNWEVAVPFVKEPDEIGRLARVVDNLFTSIAAHVAQLQTESLQDALTNLPNRRNFDQQLALLWHLSQRHAQPLTIMMIDVDYFKQFNDLYGHQAGDQALARVALTLQNALLRSTDFVARYGGEEFALILLDVDQKAAGLVAERIRSSVDALNIKHAGSIFGRVTVSIGMATVTQIQLSDSPFDLLRDADMALYAAKQSGRNQISSH